MKKWLLSLIYITSSITSYAYDTQYETKRLVENTTYFNLKHIVNSTYLVNYIEKGTSFSWHAVAYNDASHLLTSAHNLKHIRLNKTELSIYDAVEGLLPAEGYVITEIEKAPNDSDLAILTLNKKLPNDFINKNDIEADLTLLQQNDYGEVFSLGWNNKYDAGYATKLTGAENFYVGLLPDQYIERDIQLVASLKNNDINGNQINAIAGDSGGPWFICSYQNKLCKIIAIQSWRGDWHKELEYHKYRSVAVPTWLIMPSN